MTSISKQKESMGHITVSHYWPHMNIFCMSIMSWFPIIKCNLMKLILHCVSSSSQPAHLVNLSVYNISYAFKIQSIESSYHTMHEWIISHGRLKDIKDFYIWYSYFLTQKAILQLIYVPYMKFHQNLVNRAQHCLCTYT